MKVLSIGQKIITKSGKISAIITGVCIRGNNTMYDISYFAGDSHKSVWIYDFEFEVDNSEPSAPGFRPPSNQIQITDGGASERNDG